MFKRSHLLVIILLSIGCSYDTSSKYTIVINDSYFDGISFWQKRKLVKQVDKAIQDITQYFGTSYSDTLFVNVYGSKGGEARSNQVYLNIDQMHDKGLIVHEVTHAVLPHKNSGFENEGLAVFTGLKFVVDSSKVREIYRKFMYRSGCEFHSLDFLMQHNSVFWINDDCTMYAYYQAGSFYQYLEEVYGKAKLLEFCSQGVSKIESIYGVSIDSLDTAWRKWLLD